MGRTGLEEGDERKGDDRGRVLGVKGKEEGKGKDGQGKGEGNLVLTGMG